MKRGVVAVMLLWLLWPLAGAAQELMPSAWQYYIEQLSDEGDDETVEEMLELYEALHDSPVNHFRPTPSISKAQKTFNFNAMQVEDFEIQGRHDVCFALRTPVIVEALAAIVIADLVLISKTVK